MEANIFEIPPSIQNKRSSLLQVAAYCRVSTVHEEQDSSIELQILHYDRLIAQTSDWENAGIYAERVSGLNMKEPTEFKKLMVKCRRGKVDLILTKSISRLGRNTLELLQSLQQLRECEVDVWFEKENLWLHDRQMDFLITAYSAFAQAESESMSYNIRWGIKQGFRSGTSGYADFVCFGYKRGKNGELTIDEPDAEIVRTIFQMRAEGNSLGKISDWLYEKGIPSPTGHERWSRETISKLLRNEKYVGNVLLQKTFVKDLFSGKQLKNNGEREQFLYLEHHPPIINHELFDAVNKKSF